MIVGASNGMPDYLSRRDFCLDDDRPETFAEAASFSGARQSEEDSSVSASRKLAEETFSVCNVGNRLGEL